MKWVLLNAWFAFWYFIGEYINEDNKENSNNNDDVRVLKTNQSFIS